MMADNEHLNIDYKKHVVYLQSTKKVLTKRLNERFGKEQGTVLWDKTKRIYESFVNDMPYTGGNRNFMAHSLYDSIACFAYWEAMPEDRKETVEEFTKTVALVFNGDTSEKKRNPEFLTANNTVLLKAMGVLLRLVFAPMNKAVSSGKWNNAWRLRINPNKPAEGLQMLLFGCPIVDFAQKHGYMDLMPAMCNPDFDNMPELGIHLIRPKTVGMGYPVCDYRFVGDKSEAAKKSPVRMDEKGFLVNDVPYEDKKI